jgi:hypothetical protein
MYEHEPFEVDVFLKLAKSFLQSRRCS